MERAQSRSANCDTLIVKIHVTRKIVQEQQNEAQQLVMIDSGAGGTVFGSAEMLHSIEPPGQMVCIRFGNGPRIPAAGRCIVVLCVTCMDTCKQSMFQVPNALCVPTQPLNIESAHDVAKQEAQCHITCTWVTVSSACNDSIASLASYLAFVVASFKQPSKVKKLDPRSVPGTIVRIGPSTKQYRVPVLHHNIPYKVHIVRHVLVSAQNIQKYFERSAVLPELSRFVSALVLDVLRAKRVQPSTMPVEDIT
jgi:hypothetical protein